MKRIVLMTYALLMEMSDGGIGKLKPDGIILDEFHRYGAKCWGGVMRLLEVYPHDVSKTN